MGSQRVRRDLVGEQILHTIPTTRARAFLDHLCLDLSYVYSVKSPGLSLWLKLRNQMVSENCHLYFMGAEFCP